MFTICFVLVDVEIAFDNSFDSIIICVIIIISVFYLRELLIWHTKILVKNSLQHMLSVEKSENIVFTFTLLIYP